MNGEPETRSSEARQRAEQALVWLLHGLRREAVDLIVLGGLVPELLTKDQEPPVTGHLGTTDVDVLLITHVEDTPDLAPVETVLDEMKFDPDPEQDGWRWRGLVAGRRVKIEFLCDLDTYASSETVRPDGCTRLAAANLRGTGFVARDYEEQEISGALPDGEQVTVKARFAGLQGYLLSKAVAVRTRGAEKDYYDFAYVLIHNRAGGPREAAVLLTQHELVSALPALTSTFLEVEERYRTNASFGPSCYAAQMRLVDSQLEEQVLRADAVGAVEEFFGALRDQ